MKNLIISLSLLLSTLSALYAQQPLEDNTNSTEADSRKSSTGDSEEKKPGLAEWSAYGNFVYSRYSGNYTYDKYRKAYSDLEVLAVKPVFYLGEVFSIHAEIEWEHMGTGATMELDKLEEFGEYEQEVEAGGEVLLEEMYLNAAFLPYLNLMVGRIKVPVGVTAFSYEPLEHLTARHPESETRLIATPWYENGIGFKGRFDYFRYRLIAVSSLDSSAFSSAEFVARGNQTRFEQVVHEDWAYAAEFAYLPFNDDRFIGVSLYHGSVTENRPKPDLDSDATVTLGSLQSRFSYGPFLVQGSIIAGRISDSEKINNRNKQLSNALEVKRTPVAEVAYGLGIEAGVDVLSFVNFTDDRLILFYRFDNSDTQHEMAQGYYNDPRWHRLRHTAGLNYLPISNLSFKTQYSRMTEKLTEKAEHEVSCAMAFNLASSG